MKACARALLALALAVAWVGLALAPPAVAHETLVSSDPSDTGLLETMPSRARLVFDGLIMEVHELTVEGPDGSIANGAPTLAGVELRQNLWAGPEGSYVLTYDVLSSDGHEIAGEVHFEVGEVPAEAGDTDAGATPAADAVGAATGLSLSSGAVMVLMASVLIAGAAMLVRRRSHHSQP